MISIRQRLIVLALAVEVVGAAGIVSAVALHEHKNSPAEMDDQAVKPQRAFEVADAGADVSFVVRDTGPVHLFWRNGRAPFRVLFDLDGRLLHHISTRARHLAFDIPAMADKRFAVIIRDQDGHQSKVYFRLRDRDPLAQATGDARLDQTHQLARHQQGAWYLHSLSSLLNAGETESAARLASAIGGAR